MMKIWVDNYVLEKLVVSFEDSLCKLCIDVVDLMLIYWLVLGNGVLIDVFMIVLVDVKVKGFMCQIGILNFNIVLMKEVIVVVGKDVIVMNQIELSLYLQNCKLVEFLNVEGIYVMLYMMFVYGKVFGDLVIGVIVQCYDVMLV